MGVETIIVSTKLNNELYNGEDFATNPAIDFAPNLIGSVMERVRITQVIQIGWKAEASEVNPFTLKSTSITTIKRETGTWQDDGISIGDYVAIDCLGGADLRVLSNANEDTLILDPATALIADGEYEGMRIQGLSPLTALYYKFGIIGNDESLNFVSKVTGNDQGFYGVGIGYDTGGGVRSTDFVELTPLSEYADWITGTAKCRFVQDVGALQEFEVVHDFIINPYFVDGELNNLRNKEITELFKGFNTLKYANELDFRTSITNPASAKIKGMDYVLGSTGWFNENMDGLTSDYYITSISYQDKATLAAVTELQAARSTLVTITAEKINGNFLAGNKCGVYISYLPAEDEYTNKDTDFIHNFIWDSGFSIEGGAITQGKDVIKNISSQIAGSTLTVSFEIEYSTEQYARLLNAAEANYLIGLQCADISKTFVNSDRVTLIADTQEYNTDLLLEGLANVEAFEIWQPEQEVGVDAGYTDLQCWIEDGIACKLNFNLDLSKEAFISNIKQTVIAFNAGTEEYFELDSFNLPLQNAIVSGGVQQLEIDTSKGYKLPTGDDFNEVLLTTGAKVGSLQSYELLAGQKIPWQDWQAIAADAEFYDSSKPQNGLNRKASNYSDINDYTIRLSYVFSLSGVDDNGQAGAVDYLINSPQIDVLEYEESSTYTALIETFDPQSLTDLSGAVYTNKTTLLKITYTRTAGDVLDLTDFWAISRIEATGQQGFEIYELSTVKPFSSDNPLQPLAGESQLKMYLDAGKVVTECLINPVNLDSSNGFNLSGRLSGGSGVPAGAKLTESGDIKTTESGGVKIIE